MNDNINTHATNNIQLINHKEKHSSLQAISVKKRFFSSISSCQSNNQCNKNIFGKKYKSLNTSNNVNFSITINERSNVSQFNLRCQKEKKKILS